MRHSDGDVTMQGNNSARGFWGLLTGNERAVLADLGLTRDFPSGVTMCQEGDPATHLYVLMVGWVKILSVTSHGQERVLALRGNGDIVGELAGEMTGHRTATLQAIDAVHALIVRYDRFSSFLDSNPGAAHAYRRVMTQRWGDAADLLRKHPLTSGAQRLASLLLELAERHGMITEGRIDVVMPLSQEDLASLAGTSRATVTRAFRNWRDRGFVSTGQKHITITDLPRLRQIADLRM
jgi:CRP-like cAMP-binding protein